MRVALLIATMTATMGCSTLQGLLVDTEPPVAAEEAEAHGHEGEAHDPKAATADPAPTTTPETPAPIVFARSARSAEATATSGPEPARIRVFLTTDGTPDMCTVEQIADDGTHITYRCGDTPAPWSGGEPVLEATE